MLGRRPWTTLLLPGRGDAQPHRGRGRAALRSMGYQKTAVADIARELGMSPANIIASYPSKSAINEAIAQRILGAMLEEVEGDRPRPRRRRAVCADCFSALFERKIEVFFRKAPARHGPPPWRRHRDVVERHLAGVHAGVTMSWQREWRPASSCQAMLLRKRSTVRHTTVPWNHPALGRDCIDRKGQTRRGASRTGRRHDRVRAAGPPAVKGILTIVDFRSVVCTSDLRAILSGDRPCVPLSARSSSPSLAAGRERVVPRGAG